MCFWKEIWQRKKITYLGVEDVNAALKKGTNRDIQKCKAWIFFRSLDIPVITVYKILLNILHCYSYKIIQILKMLCDDLP